MTSPKNTGQTKQQPNEPETTGHVWDGIEEYNNPLPRWWVWTFYVTIVWGIAYAVAYPAWPLISGATPGMLGYSSRGAVAAEIDRYAEANRPLEEALVAAELTEIEANAELASFARNGGAAVFRTRCAQCHGAGAAGSKGYPNLLDDDWLWGGDLTAIEETIQHGIRVESDDDTRFSEMPAFDEMLSDEEIAAVTGHVLSLSNASGGVTSEMGALAYEDNCASCHGDDGKGGREFGAPNLADAIWLFGGDADSVEATIRHSRYGVMPAWSQQLSEAQIRQVAIYIHGLGGGE
ncbi:MAG: cytochrome-c oxidase, cbb3-type subunit III [Pikeienuella sp.]